LAIGALVLTHELGAPRAVRIGALTLTLVVGFTLQWIIGGRTMRPVAEATRATKRPLADRVRDLVIVGALALSLIALRASLEDRWILSTILGLLTLGIAAWLLARARREKL
jgi:hypothetical protein